MEYNPECPQCSSNKIDLNISCCVDNKCCGIPHSISCWDCDYLVETYSQDTSDILDKWIELGGNPEDGIL